MAWAFELTPEGLRRTAEVSQAESITRRTGRKLDFVIIGVLLLIIGLLVVNRYRPVAVPVARHEKSIAVLPFENLSEDRANAFFADGMQHDVLSSLAKIKELKVISRSSVMGYGNLSSRNLREIGEQLDVAHVLEGSVRREANRVIVNVALIDCRNNRRLWSERYDRTVPDTLTLQSELAHEIATNLRATLTPEERARVDAKPTWNADAYEAYLRGLAHEGRYTSSNEATKARIDAYGRAVQLDPLFALAWAALARARTDLYFLYDHNPKLLGEAKQALDKAMELAPDQGEVLSALGRYRYWGTGDYDGAVEAYTRARQLLPNSASIVVNLGNVKRRQGKWLEALSLQREAARLDPRNNPVWIACGITLHTLRRYDEALAAFDQGLEVVPGDTELLAKKIFMYQAMGDLDAAERIVDLLRDSDNYNVIDARNRQFLYRRNYQGAIAALQRVLSQRNSLTQQEIGQHLKSLGMAELLKGEREAGLAHLNESRQVIEALMKAGDDNPESYMALADVCSLLGDTNAAVQHAQSAIAALSKDAFSLHSARAVLARAQMRAGETDSAIALLQDLLETPSSLSPALLQRHPVWDPLRNDPRFQQLASAPPKRFF